MHPIALPNSSSMSASTPSAPPFFFTVLYGGIKCIHIARLQRIGITLPPSDSFWDKYFPPNGWNCRCTVVQVRKGKYPTSDPDMAMLSGENCTAGAKQQIFRYNPGKSLLLFPPKHPYYKAPADAKVVIEEVSAEEMRAKRIQDIIAELPDTLTQSEKQVIAENCLENRKELWSDKR